MEQGHSILRIGRTPCTSMPHSAPMRRDFAPRFMMVDCSARSCSGCGSAGRVSGGAARFIPWALGPEVVAEEPTARDRDPTPGAASAQLAWIR